MLNIWMSITSIGIFIGIVLTIITSVKCIKILKQILKLNNNQIIPEDIRVRLQKTLTGMIVGSSLYSVCGIVRIFLR